MPSWVTWLLIGLAAVGLFFVLSPEPALIIEGQQISQAEFAKLYDNLVEQYQRVYRQDFKKLLQGIGGIERRFELQTRLVDDLVRRRLITQEVRRRQILIPKSDVDDQTEIEFERILKQNRITEEQAAQILKEQGSSLERFKRELRQVVELNMQTEHLSDQVVGPIQPSDQELSVYLEQNRNRYDKPEQVHARHILIRVEPDAPEADVVEAQKQLEDLKKELEGGADFAELAQKHSQDPGSAPNGGDLGFFGRGQMVKEFEEAAFALEPGQISEPVRTQFGFHLIKVEEKKPAEHPGLSQIRDQVLKDFVTAEREKRFNAWYKELKQKAKITITDPLLRVFYLLEREGRLDEALAAYAKLGDQKAHIARVLRKKLDALGPDVLPELALGLKQEILSLWLTQLAELSDRTERLYGLSQILGLKPNELPGQALFQITAVASVVDTAVHVLQQRLKAYGIKESIALPIGEDQILVWLRLPEETSVRAVERLLSLRGQFELKRVLREGEEELKATGLGEQALKDRAGRYFLVVEAPVVSKIEIKEIAVQTNPAPAGPIVRLRLAEKTRQELAKALSGADETLAIVVDGVVYGTIILGSRALLQQKDSVLDLQFEDSIAVSLEDSRALAITLQVGALPTTVKVSRP